MKTNYTITIKAKSHTITYCVVAVSQKQALYHVSQEKQFNGETGIVPSFEQLDNSRQALDKLMNEMFDAYDAPMPTKERIYYPKES